MPERVAAGEVTEQGGPWNRAVQRITYLSTADKTRQPMMFYKPKRDEPRPLLVGLHSSSNTRSVDGNIAAAEFMNEPTLVAMGGAPAGYDAVYGRDFKVFYVFGKQGVPDMLHLPLSRSMGRLAKQEVHVVARNTLVAIDYGLLDDETLTPKPNYWGALLWRKLMGTTVRESGIPLPTGQV